MRGIPTCTLTAPEPTFPEGFDVRVRVHVVSELIASFAAFQVLELRFGSPTSRHRPILDHNLRQQGENEAM